MIRPDSVDPLLTPTEWRAREVLAGYLAQGGELGPELQPLWYRIADATTCAPTTTAAIPDEEVMSALQSIGLTL